MNHLALRSRVAMPGCVLALALLCAPSWGQTPLSPEERLEAIRHSLLQAAMEGPMQVRATSWIDAQGVLRDSSSFQSGMQVRGVKVLSYSRDAQGKPTADMRWLAGASQAGTAPNLATRTAAKGASACAAVGRERPFRHQIGIQVSTQGNWPVDEVPMVQAARELLLRDWQMASDASPVWRLTERSREAGSSYEKVLLASSADEIPWQANLRLSPAVASEAATPLKKFRPYWLPADPAPVLVQVDFSITARNQSKPVMQTSTVIALQPEQQRWAAPRVSEVTRELIEAQVQGWAQELMQQLACEPLRAEVIMTGKQEARINAGALAGVRVGDEWLLADAKRLPRQVLEPGATGQTVLARVQAVSAHHAELQLLAGPSDSVALQWRAWSADPTK